jgi:hypothetical protein
MKVILGKPQHEQSRIAAKNPLVDTKMVGVLKWFNSFDILTLASCQSKPGKEPYVMWVSFDQKHTIRVLSVLDHKEVTTIRYNEIRNCIVYVTRWPTLEYLEDRLEYYRQNS